MAEDGITAAGPDLRETVSIMREGDSHCCPTGGTKARLWHWNGTRFTPGPWKQVTPGDPAEGLAFSPLPGKDSASCYIRDDGSARGSWVYCWTGLSERRPIRSVKMGLDGRLDLVATIPVIQGKGGPPLRVGGQLAVGRFRCLSLRSGFKCTVVQSGKGFLFNETGATRIEP